MSRDMNVGIDLAQHAFDRATFARRRITSGKFVGLKPDVVKAMNEAFFALDDVIDDLIRLEKWMKDHCEVPSG